MRWLITGASGLLGGYLVRHLRATSEEVVAWSGSQQSEVAGNPVVRVDLVTDNVIHRFKGAQADFVIHAAAVARVDECRREPDKARRVNVEATRTLAGLASLRGARFVFVSTDLVFDGERGNYREGDPPNPLTVYGRSKADAEALLLTYFPRAAIARLSLLYGPGLTGRTSFFDRMVDALRHGRSVPLFADEWRTPLDLPTAAAALVALSRSDVTGVVHVGGRERLSRLEMGTQLADVLGVSGESIVVTGRNNVPSGEPRPRDTSLDSSRWRGLFPEMPWATYRQALLKMLAPA